MKIYRAYYDSRNFSFEAYSQTKNGAIENCKEGLRQHGKEYKLQPEWFMFGDVDGIECDAYELDTPYRDRSKV